MELALTQEIHHFYYLKAEAFSMLPICGAGAFMPHSPTLIKGFSKPSIMKQVHEHANV